MKDLRDLKYLTIHHVNSISDANTPLPFQEENAGMRGCCSVVLRCEEGGGELFTLKTIRQVFMVVFIIVKLIHSFHKGG